MKHGKLWSRLLAALCAWMLVMPLVTSALAATYPYDTVSMDNVNMRSRANTTSTVLKKIKAGDTVTILGATGSYYHVKFDGKTGYAQKLFIDGLDPSADEPMDESRTLQAPPAAYTYPYETLVLQTVKLRKKAEAEAAVIRTLLEGSTVEVLGRTDNGFAKVKYDGKTGYVVETHINLADIPGPTPKPTATPKPGTENYTELKVGDSGSAVTALQSVLAELGYLDASGIDGKFGSMTETALKAFQKRNSYSLTGVATPEMQLKIYEDTPRDSRGYRQYVKTVAPVPGALIRKNSNGEAVSRLQTRLKELGYYAGEVTGVCGEDTVSAILMFEGNNGLVADGEASAADQQVLFGAAALDASVKATPTPAPTLAPPSKTLRRSDKGEDVKSLQQRLKELGYYTGKISGTYNEATEEAVKTFQKKSSLEVDGVCGPVTRTVLYGTNAIYAVPTAIPVVATPTLAPAAEPITEENVVIIRSGSMGPEVLRLQQRLQELGYYVSRQDGVYLTDDIEAVRAFQSANGLKVDGKAGYNTQTALYSDGAIRGNGLITSTEDGTAVTLRYGSEGDSVTALQNRLIALGYLSGTADGKYGSNTKAAVKAFQRASSLKADGVAGAETQNALYGDSAATNTVVSATETLRIGTISDAVREMQNRLIALGYLKGTADGNFGTQTSLALLAFQKANGLIADGVAGKQTLSKLNASNVVGAVTPQATPAPVTQTAPTVSSGSVNASQVRYANWYSEVKAKCRQYPNATVYDFTTGISWQVNMFSLGAHADSEPITAADTAAMNRAFGGKTTWTPKPVWVVLSDGTVFMASTHNTPHDTYHVKTNNFDGHVCIHFPRTQQQVEKIGPYATSHQKAIDLGWAATLRRAK